MSKTLFYYWVSSLIIVALLLLLLWQIFPAAVLKPYNDFFASSTTLNGQTILDARRPEFIDPEPGSETRCFKPVEIDPDYHSEGASIADINRDGLKDIITGHFWYQAPDWHKRTIRTPEHKPIVLPKPSDYIQLWFAEEPDFFNQVYPLAFYTFHKDIDGDGWVDVIAVDRTFSHGVRWFKNPGASELSRWTAHPVVDITLGETPLFRDILGQGSPQVIVPVDHGEGLSRLQAMDWDNTEPVFTDLMVSPSPPGINILRNHGLGVGDINGDGLPDIVTGPGYRIQPSGSEVAAAQGL